MSRSRRKHPFCGWTTAQSDKWFKRLSQRRERRANKVRLLHGEDLLHPFEITNPFWSPKDGKQRFDDQEDGELRRK